MYVCSEEIRKGSRVFIVLIVLALLCWGHGCSKPYGLSDVDVSGSGKILEYELVRFDTLHQVTLDAIRGAGLDIIEEIKQPEFNVIVIKAQGADVGMVKVRIRSLSEISQELILFRPEGGDPAKERDVVRQLRQEIEKRL